MDPLSRNEERYLIIGAAPPLGDAVRYTLNQRATLEVYTKNGDLEIDNTPLERLNPIVAVGRRNYLLSPGALPGAVTSCQF